MQQQKRKSGHDLTQTSLREENLTHSLCQSESRTEKPRAETRMENPRPLKLTS